MIRQLPSGNLLLNCAGIEVEGITAEQKRDILKAQIELDAARRELELLRSLKRDYEAISGLFQSERVAREKEAALLQEEVGLLKAYRAEDRKMIEQLVRQTKRNRLEAALSNPLLTLVFKLAVPVVGMFR